MSFLRKFFLLLLPFFYIGAGLNHFLNPNFYLPVIPNYLLFPEIANYLAGLLEIGLGILFISPSLRRFASLGIIILLIQFIPVHIDFIVRGSCIENVICVDEWMGYARLLIIHPLLIFWALAFINNEETYLRFSEK